MNIPGEANKGFLTTLFHENEIVSVQLPTSYEISENVLSVIKILVIVSPFQQEAEEKDQLNKILSACRLSPGEYTVLQANCSWAQLRKFENIQSVILFGVSEKSLNISVIFNENQIIKFDDKNWIKTYSLQKLIADAAAKNVLWQQALRPLFIG